MRTPPPSVQTHSQITRSCGNSGFGVFEEALYWFSRDAMVYSHQQYTGVALTTASLVFILIDGKNRISMHFWFVFLWWISVVNIAPVLTAVYRSTSENCLLVLCPHAWPCLFTKILTVSSWTLGLVTGIPRNPFSSNSLHDNNKISMLLCGTLVFFFCCCCWSSSETPQSFSLCFWSWWTTNQFVRWIAIVPTCLLSQRTQYSYLGQK